MAKKIYDLDDCRWHGEDPEDPFSSYPCCTFDKGIACSLKLGKTCQYVPPGMRKYLKEKRKKNVKSNLDI